MNTLTRFTKLDKFICLSIGISNYSTEGNQELGQEFENLPSAAFGSRAVANKYKSLGFETQLLENPSSDHLDEVVQNLMSILKSYKLGRTVLVYVQSYSLYAG